MIFKKKRNFTLEKQLELDRDELREENYILRKMAYGVVTPVDPIVSIANATIFNDYLQLPNIEGVFIVDEVNYNAPSEMASMNFKFRLRVAFGEIENGKVFACIRSEGGCWKNYKFDSCNEFFRKLHERGFDFQKLEYARFCYLDEKLEFLIDQIKKSFIFDDISKEIIQNETKI